MYAQIRLIQRRPSKRSNSVLFVYNTAHYLPHGLGFLCSHRGSNLIFHAHCLLSKKLEAALIVTGEGVWRSNTAKIQTLPFIHAYDHSLTTFKYSIETFIHSLTTCISGVQNTLTTFEHTLQTFKYSIETFIYSNIQRLDWEINSTNKESCRRRGRPSFDIKEEQLSFLVENDFKVPEISAMLGVSTRTVERRLSSFGIRISGKP